MPDDPTTRATFRLILASASPRRRELLEEAGWRFVVDPARIDEDAAPANLLPAELARFLALEKARIVAARHPDDVVLAADTVVAFGDTPVGKPADADDARDILRLLSGTTHIVITGVAVVRRASGFEQARWVMSSVRMRCLTEGQIEAYIATGQWQGKAGAYGIQDRDPFVTRVAGSHTNVVGLPMEAVGPMLRQAGASLDG